MKQEVKDDSSPPRKSSGWLTLIALLALGFTATAYTEVHRSKTTGERDEAMLVQLNEVAHLHILLGELGKGHLDSVRQQLKVQLAEDVAAVQPLTETAGDEPARYARTVLATMQRYEKAHPDYYQTACPSPASGKLPVAQSGSQMAASRVAAH